MMRNFAIALLTYHASALKSSQTYTEPASNSSTTPDNSSTGLNDEELYGGMREDIKEFVLKSDQDGDGFTTAREFLYSMGAPNSEQILTKYVQETHWWKDGEFMKDATQHLFDQDANGMIDLQELDKILDTLRQDRNTEQIYNQYASAPTVGLTMDELSELLESWAWNVPGFPDSPKIDLHTYTKEEMYGGLRGDMESWVQRFDSNSDGVTFVREFLESINQPDIDQLLAHYDNDTFMWWRDPYFVAKAAFPVMETINNDGMLSLYEVLPYLDQLVTPDRAKIVYYIYATKPADGLTMDNAVRILEDWSIDRLDGEYHVVPDWVSQSDEQLYGHMHPKIKDFVGQFDTKGDYRVPILDFVMAVGCPESVAYGIIAHFGQQNMWWTDGEVLRQAFNHLIDTNNNANYEREEVIHFMGGLGHAHDAELIYNDVFKEPSSDVVLSSVTAEQMDTFLKRWAFGEFEKPREVLIEEVRYELDMIDAETNAVYEQLDRLMERSKYAKIIYQSLVNTIE